MKVHITVTPLGLISTGAVEIPDRKVVRFDRFFFHSFCFTAHTFAGAVDPNVQDLNSLALIKAHVFVEKRVAFRHVSGDKRSRGESLI